MKEKFLEYWKRRWVRWPALIFGVPFVGGLALILIMDQIVMPLWTRHGSEFPAPTVVGQSLRAAQDVLGNAGFSMQIAERRYSADFADGTILEQRPSAGSLVKKGRVFSVVVSRGSELIDVPYVRGYTLRQAELIISQSGLLVGGKAGEPDDSIPAGTVVRTIPSAGSRLQRGGVVNILVNEPGDRSTTWCPNLVGTNIEEARNILRDRSLLVGTIDRQYDTTLLPGTILRQSYPPGERLDAGAEVDLVISRDR